MKIQECIKEFKLKRTDKVVIKDFRVEAFEQKGMSGTIYEDSELYYLRVSIPFDFNEKGVYSIEWGEWLKNILAIESNAFGVEMLVSISRGGMCNILKKNPEKSFEGTPYTVSYLMPPPGQLTLKL